MESFKKILQTRNVFLVSLQLHVWAEHAGCFHTHIYTPEGCFLEYFSSFITQMCLSAWAGTPLGVYESCKAEKLSLAWAW